MTLEELELWFTVFIVYCYHHRPHKGINKVPPIKMYNHLVHGSDESPGVGMPAAIVDEDNFRLDFTPYTKRTVQRDGVVWDHIQYFSPALRPWINAKDENGKGQTFIFARDPRDISVIYFLDPSSHSYVPIPYLNNTRPAISLWELRAVTKQLDEDPLRDVNEDMIFKGIKKMREIEQEAIEKTRLARQQRATEKRKRRMAERRAGWNGVHQDLQPKKHASVIDRPEDDDDDIQPFSDIQTY